MLQKTRRQTLRQTLRHSLLGDAVKEVFGT